MGFKKSFAKSISKLPGGKSPIGTAAYGAAIGAGLAAFTGGSSLALGAAAGASVGAGAGITTAGTTERKEIAKNTNAVIAEQKRQENIAELERQKQIANESVRAQEDQARRRTIFGGGSIDEQTQRKTLLGL